MHSSGPSLQDNLHNNIAVNGAEREFGIPRRYTDTEKQWSGTMDDSGVIILIQALGDAKIAKKWVMNTHTHPDFASNI